MEIVGMGLHDCVHKIPVELPSVVSPTAFYEPNHSAVLNRRYCEVLPIPKSYRKTSGNKHGLSVLRKPVKAVVG